MEVEIYEGDKIGGCITEIRSKNGKIIFDYGKNLDNTDQISIPGLTIGAGKPEYDAVFISHYHADHIGCINKIHPDIDVYVEQKSKEIYDIVCDFTNEEKRKTIPFTFDEGPIEIKGTDFEVTPYKVDHSAYNSSMFVISDGKEKVLYTGDYRDNGPKGEEFEETLNKIGEVKYLITEGTTLGRKSHSLEKEEDLIKKFEKVFDKYKQVFVLMSASNIDRISTIYKATKNKEHVFIQDLYMAHLTSTIGDDVPNPLHDNIMVWQAKYFESDRYLRNKIPDFKKQYITEKFEGKKIEDFTLKTPFVMNIRSSMIKDLENSKEKLNKACLIYSMWGGYKKKEDTKKFIERVKALGIKIINPDIHASGHAAEELIKKVIKTTKVKEENIYIIHTDVNRISYSKEVIEGRLKEALKLPKILYKETFINYKGNCKDTEEKYTEYISKELLKKENLDKLKSIMAVTRTKSYDMKHNGKKTTKSKDGESNRKEEEKALELFNASKEGKTFGFLGEMIDYQVPLKDKHAKKDENGNHIKEDPNYGLGKIDLVSYNKETNEVFLLELKKPKTKENETEESLLRCVLESYTYFKSLDHKKFLKDLKLPLDCIIRKSALVYKNSRQYLDYKNDTEVNKLMDKIDVGIAVLDDEDNIYYINTR